MRVLIVDDIPGWRDYNSERIKEIYDDVEITVAVSAKDAYEKIMLNSKTPFDIIITDMQMELDFEPKHAGEWLIEQVKTFSGYYKTKIVIVSGASNIRKIAENYCVDFIPKSSAVNFPQLYSEILKKIRG